MSQHIAYDDWALEVGRRLAQQKDGIALYQAGTPTPHELLAGCIRIALAAYDAGYSGLLGAAATTHKRIAARFEVSDERVLCTSGARSSAAIVMRSLLRPGDHAVVETPCYETLRAIAQSTGAEVGSFERDIAGSIDIRRVAAALRSNTRLIVITNLHNPSGALTEDQTFRELIALASSEAMTILVDEVFHEFSDLGTAARLSEKIVAVSSLSKFYGLPSLRCGWIIASPEHIRQFSAHLRLSEFGRSELTQGIASVVLERCHDFESHALAMLSEGRSAMATWACRWRSAGLIEGDLPARGCLYFPRIVGVGDTRRWCEQVLERYGVAVAPGEHFGVSGHIRIGMSRPHSHMWSALARLDQALCGCV